VVIAAACGTEDLGSVPARVYKSFFRQNLAMLLCTCIVCVISAKKYVCKRIDLKIYIKKLLKIPSMGHPLLTFKLSSDASDFAFKMWQKSSRLIRLTFSLFSKEDFVAKNLIPGANLTTVSYVQRQRCKNLQRYERV
jgi:hypothetical protein